MNQKQFIKKLEEGYANNIQISRMKNADYASTEDPFRNFRASEILGLTVEQGILIRMSDKLVRVSNLLNKKAQVKDEAVTDTLSDLANYAMILKVYLDSRSKRQERGESLAKPT